MKRILSLFLALALLLSALPALAEGKTLVVYFSRAGENYSVGHIDEGNTAKLAKVIAEELNADLFEIIPETPYPDSYDETLTIATSERNEKARPAYLGAVENWADYDTVLIGYPIWWGGLPMILYSFAEDYDWTGKTAAPFNTHEGSGQGGTVSEIEALTQGASLLKGLAVRGSRTQSDPDGTANDVRNWLKSIGFAE